jgi:ribosome modulation factor
MTRSSFIVEAFVQILYSYCVGIIHNRNCSQRILTLKRQKRDKLSRAHSKGYQAGMIGRSKDNCPFQASGARSEWLGGWREAIDDRNLGFSK